MSADKAPAAKLPLAVRKNFRDSYENKKEGFESELTALLGTPWTVSIDPLSIYPYAEPDSYGANSLGDCVAAYVSGAIYQLKYFLEKHAGGKDEINAIATAHTLTLAASTEFSYCGSDFENGIWRLVFNPTSLGTNIDHAAQSLAEALNKAPQPAGASVLSFAARHSIQQDYTPNIDALLATARKALNNPDFKFEPGFDEVATALKDSKDVRDDWQTNLGDFVYKYFEAFVDVLKNEKFAEDDMLQEGFAEGVPKGVVKLQVLDKIEVSYNQTVIVDGAVVIQTTPSNWGTNIHYAGQKLVDLL